MPWSRSKVVAVFLGVLVSLISARPADAQIAVITVRSVDTLRSDLQYLAPLVEQGEWVKQLEAFLQETTGGTGLDGVDTKRPFGCYANWPDQVKDLDSLDIPTVAFVPVTAEKPFLDLLQKLHCQPREADEGMHRLVVPVAGTELFLRFANGYAYASTKPVALRGQLPDPATFLVPERSRSTLSARLYVTRFPKEHRQTIDGIVERIRRELEKEIVGKSEKKSGKNEAQNQQQQASADEIKAFTMFLKEAVGRVDSLIDQIREMTIHLDIDPKQHHLTVDLTVVPKADNALAFSKYVGMARSKLSYLTVGANLGLFIHFPAPESARQQAAVPEYLPEPFHSFVDPKYRDALLKLLQILISTVTTDGLDFGLAVREGPSADDSVTVAGLKVHNGRKLEHLIRDWLKNLPAVETDGFSIQWTVDKHAQARIHKFRLPGEDEDAYLAIRDDVVFFATGKHGLKAIKEALDGFGKAATTATPLLQVSFSSALLDKEQAEAVHQGVSSGDRDKVRGSFRFQGGKDLHLRLELHTYLLRLLPKLLKEGG